MVAMMAMRALLGWKVAESRQKLANLPVDVLVTEDEEKAKIVYRQFIEAGVEVAVNTVNGLGESLTCNLETETKGKSKTVKTNLDKAALKELKDKLKELLDKYCMGIQATDAQLDEILDKVIATGADYYKAAKYI